MPEHKHPAGRRIRQEKRTIDALLGVYCHDLHGGAGGARAGLCASCTRLRDYAHRRLDTCPFQEEKPVCNRCEVHCYSQTMREQVREVMRYTGPRMPLRHPWLALLHLFDKLRAVPKLVRRSRRAEPPVRQGGCPQGDPPQHD
jgi:Nitrous oxide-stimulated promoter